MRTYLEEKLEWRMGKDKGNSRIAETFVEIRGPRRPEDRSGGQRGYTRSSARNVQFESGGMRGRTPYPGRPQASHRREFFNVVEEEGPTDDVWGCGPDGKDSGQEVGRSGKS